MAAGILGAGRSTVNRLGWYEGRWMALPPVEELEAMGLAWARVAPTVALVPAFGLKALPTPARAVSGLALAAAIYPAVGATAGAHLATGPWVARALVEMVAGLPVALAAAIPLWAATMAGGVVDGLRGASDGAGLAVVEDRPSGFGVLFSLLASTIFLSTGGPSRVASALVAAPPAGSPVIAAAHDLVGGIGVAVAVGAPLLATAVVLEIAFALVARASTPAQVHALFAPLRALGLLAVVAVVLERIAALLALAARASP